MILFLRKVRKANLELFWLGTAHVLLVILLAAYFPFNEKVVLGLNSLIKPMKFAASFWIFSWTMALLLQHLQKQRKVKVYSWVAIIVAGFEQTVITVQAFRGKLSHFNISHPLDAFLFSLMGLFIVTLMAWTVYMVFLFFQQKTFRIPLAYIWGIRIGIILFVIFSLEGGMMASRLSHTVGAPDGSLGLPFTNWSTRFGDLRIAHFMGIHALQVIPLVGWVLSGRFSEFASMRYLMLFSLIYAGVTTYLLVKALAGLPPF